MDQSVTKGKCWKHIFRPKLSLISTAMKQERQWCNLCTRLFDNASVFNSLPHGRCDSNLKCIIFTFIQNCSLGTHCDLVPRWMLRNPTNERLTLFQVMAWCRKAPSHYLSQCWLGSLSPYAVPRPECVKGGVCVCVCFCSNLKCIL